MLRKKECKVINGELYCKKGGRWRKAGGGKINFQSTKPIKVGSNLKRKRSNVC